MSWGPKATCYFTHRLQQSSWGRLLLPSSGARPRCSQQQLMPLPLDWNKRQLWALALLLFYHGGSRSPQRRHWPRQHPQEPHDWFRLSPFPTISGLEKPISFQYSPLHSPPRIVSCYWSALSDVRRVRFQDWWMELESRLGALCLVGGSALTGFWRFAQCCGVETWSWRRVSIGKMRGVGGCGIWRRCLGSVVWAWPFSAEGLIAGGRGGSRDPSLGML